MQVFLSHASEDNEVVGELCQRLKADGFDPWLDEERLIPGMESNFEIEQALRASDAVLLCFSSLSVEKEGHIQREYKRAMSHAEEKPEGTIYVIPVRLDDCMLPPFVHKYQSVDYPAGYDRLVASLQKRDGKLASMPPMPVPGTAAPKRTGTVGGGINIQAQNVQIGGDVIAGSKYVYHDENTKTDSLDAGFRRIQREIERLQEDAEIDRDYIKSFVDDIEEQVRVGSQFDGRRLKTSLKLLRQSSETVYSWVIDLLCAPNVDVDQQIRKFLAS